MPSVATELCEGGVTTLHFFVSDLLERVRASLKQQSKAWSSCRFRWLMVLLTMIVLPMVVVFWSTAVSETAWEHRVCPDGWAHLKCSCLQLSWRFHCFMLGSCSRCSVMSQGVCSLDLGGRLEFYWIVSADVIECALSVCALVVQWKLIERWYNQCIFQSITILNYMSNYFLPIEEEKNYFV